MDHVQSDIYYGFVFGTDIMSQRAYVQPFSVLSHQVLNFIKLVEQLMIFRQSSYVYGASLHYF